MPSLRKPAAEDGADIWRLVRACKPLDENSMYCNLVQCDHFRDTCIVAEMDGEIVGWVSGYKLPDDPETLFVWQVAVSETARGTGLGTLMLRGLLSRENCKGVTRVQTTITRDNGASWALFRKFTELSEGELSSAPYFSKDEHFDTLHDTEYMVTISLKARTKKAA
jgi:L-2,4-diaminobutyric acid acetyltransferase